MNADLEFPKPTQPLSINRVRHWAQKQRACQPWRDMAWAAARSELVRLRRGRRVVEPVPVTVQVVIPFERHARRDAHNYTGTVVKAVVDGIKLAGVVPDDTTDWVTVLDPELVVTKDPRVVVRIRPRES